MAHQNDRYKDKQAGYAVIRMDKNDILMALKSAVLDNHLFDAKYWNEDDMKLLNDVMNKIRTVRNIC